jgi:hypothetical protein
MRRPYLAMRCPYLAMRRPYLAMRRPYLAMLHAFVARLHAFVAVRHAFVARLHAFVAMRYPFLGTRRAFLVTRSASVGPSHPKRATLPPIAKHRDAFAAIQEGLREARGALEGTVQVFGFVEYMRAMRSTASIQIAPGSMSFNSDGSTDGRGGGRPEKRPRPPDSGEKARRRDRTRRRGSEKEELVFAEGRELLEDRGRRPERTHGLDNAYEVFRIRPDEQIEVLGEARLRVKADRPAADDEILSARSGQRRQQILEIREEVHASP